jgi:chromosome segregation ATPase
VSSTTEHLDYAETPAQKSRHELERDLTRARGRIAKLVNELAEAKRDSKNRAAALAKARTRIAQLERANATIHKSWAESAVEAHDLRGRLSTIKQALNT